jgi:hypothetical protein
VPPRPLALKTEIRPTVPDDLQYVIGESLPCRIKALTVLIDGRVVGIGGVAFPAHGAPVAFVQQSDDAKRYPVAFHKAGLAAMKMIRESGVAEVLSTADPENEKALRWLERLGFTLAEHQSVPGRVLYVWRRRDQNQINSTPHLTCSTNSGVLAESISRHLLSSHDGSPSTG